MPIIQDATKYAIADPFKRTNVYHTETMGDLPVDPAGYVWTPAKETADEIKEKQPWMVVSEVRGIRPPTRVMFTMPAMPFETEWDRRHKAG